MPQGNFPALTPAPLPPISPPAQPPLPRVPLDHDGVQVNFCKNPTCANFGVPIAATAARGRGAVNPYTVVASGAGLPMGRCNACNEHFPFKSNRGIAEERDRMAAYLVPIGATTCPTGTCANHAVPVGTPGAYQAYGTTKGGSRRWRCCACGKTFSASARPTLRQRQPSKNRLIFKLLINKSPLNRIAEVAEVNIGTVFHRLHFIHEQCVAFAADRERRLATLPIERLYISVDRQDHIINWQARKDRRNIVLSTVGSVDNATGYCFGLHLNYDPSSDPARVEAEALALNDQALPAPHRRFSRLWLQADYDLAVRQSRKKQPTGTSLTAEIDDAYRIAQARPDIESPEAPSKDERLPISGMQTRLEYTLYGHFMFLHSLLRNVGKWRFFLDQDSGIRAACLATFREEITGRTCDAFFVRINKDLGIDQKRRACIAADRLFAAERAAHPGMKDHEIVQEIFKRQMASMTPHGRWSDRWLAHPLPTISEPELAISYLTDFGDYDPNHLALLYAKASLHGVDSLFNQLRRRSSMLERSLHLRSNAGRIWSGYAPYRPEHTVAILDILRTAHNFIWVGDDGMTPAMRIGLAKAPLDYEDIIHFG